MKFTIDQLLALDAIVRTGSFAAAGEELHKVPSAVSYLVRELESSLDVAIFDRSRRKAVLTPSGQRLLDLARNVLSSGAELERVASYLKDGWEPELQVVVDGALPMGPINRCLRRFADPAVPTRLRLEVEYQEGVVDRFDGSSADIALVLGFKGDGDDDGYDCVPLDPLTLVLVASPEHPLARGPLGKKRQAGHAELIVRDSSPRFSRRSKGSWEGNQNIVFLSDFHSKRSALLDAAGYGWIPRHFIESDLQAGTLVLLDAEPAEWTYHPQIITRVGHELGRGGDLFLETLAKPS